MTRRLTLSQSGFRTLAAGFADRQARIAFCPGGVGRLPERMEFLVHAVQWDAPSVPDSGPLIIVRAAHSAEELRAVVRASRCWCFRAP
jgi:hypothetical protein